MRTLAPILSFALALLGSSCAMFGDLEGQHPFETECPVACPPDADGVCQCVVEDGQTNSATNNVTPNNATTNNTTTNNGTVTPTNNTNQCKPDGSTCCPDSAGGVDVCCDMANDPNCDPTNNRNPIGDFSLAIVDASLECGNGFGDGANIMGVEVLVNGVPLPLEVLAFQPGTGAMPWSVDELEAILSRGATDPSGMCDAINGGSVGLGCGGSLLIGLAGLTNSSMTDFLTVRISAAGPQCDNGLDAYDVYACPTRDFQVGIPDGCVLLADQNFGPWERSGRPADFLSP